MRKIRILDLVRYQLETTTTNTLHALLTQPAEPATRPATLHHMGLLALLTKEVRELQLTLLRIGQACYYGQHGGEPSDYEAALPYDPYHDIDACLTGTADLLACRTLSEELQTYLTTMPPLDCERGLGTGTTCSLPSHAFGSQACSRAQLHQLSYYSLDMQQLQTLVGQRASFPELLALL